MRSCQSKTDGYGDGVLGSLWGGVSAPPPVNESS